MNDAACTVLSVRCTPFAVPRGLLKSSPNVSCQVADSVGHGTIAVLVTRSYPVDVTAAEQQQQQHPAAASLSQQEQQQQQQRPQSELSNNMSRTHSAANTNMMMTMMSGCASAAGDNASASAASTAGGVTVRDMTQTAADLANSIVIQRIPIATPAAVDPAAGGAAGGCSTSKFSQEAIATWRLARYLALANAISPRMLVNVLPLIAAYRHAGAEEKAAVYLCQPHMSDTLASAARAAPCTVIQTSQVRTIARELLDALSILHKNGIVVLDMTPATIRVNLALKTRSDVAIAMSRPVLAHSPMLSQLFLKLLDLPTYGHRYLAPEVVAQVINAATSSASSVADPAIYAVPETESVVVSTASDIWSLGCILAELVMGKPLFPSENIRDHPALVSRILSVSNFPETAHQAAQMIGAIAPPPSSARHSVFSGIQVSSALATALAAADTSFRQLIAAMLQIDPVLRPSAEDVIKSPFVAMGIAGNVTGSSRGVGIDGSVMTKQFGAGHHHHYHGSSSGAGGRRLSGASSGSRPAAAGSGGGGGGKTATRSGGGGGSTFLPDSTMGSTAGGGGGVSPLLIDCGRDWALADPNKALQVVFESAPVMP